MRQYPSSSSSNRQKTNVAPAMESLEPRLQFTTLPHGFSETLVAGNIGGLTALDVLPDGRVLITTQTGDVRIVKNGALLPTPVIHFDVDSSGERGLLGIAHDPNFATNHLLYLYHTVPAGGRSPSPFNQVSRITINGDVAQAGSQVDILDLNPLSSASNHNGGAIHFGKDNSLYVDVGENANPSNAQTLNTLLGKVLRIDVSHTTAGDRINDVAKLIPHDNPFVGNASGINQAIYALGVRNPFTFAVEPGTGTIFINDVGKNTWEEIDRLVPGSNYGWNASEGFAPQNPPTGLGPGVYQDPLVSYNHSNGPAGGGTAIIGGVFYDPSRRAAHPFPRSYIGKYFYGDLGGNWIRTFNLTSPGSIRNPDTSASFAKQTDANPVGMALASDGGIYYVAIGNGGELLKISYTDTSRPTITNQPLSHTVALGQAATFSVIASSTERRLAYQWQRNDGPAREFQNIAGATASVYTLPDAQIADSTAQFRVIVTSSSSNATSTVATLTVSPRHAPVPKIAITRGLRNGKFDAGTNIGFSLSATDVEDRAEPASRFTYQVDYVKNLATTHRGEIRNLIPPTTGRSTGSFTPVITGPNVGTDVVYRITFTTRDADGFSSTTVVNISPNTSTITLGSNPAGLTLIIDGETVTATTALSSIVGFVRTLQAPRFAALRRTAYSFSDWSDAQLAIHSIITPDHDITYIATYRPAR